MTKIDVFSKDLPALSTPLVLAVTKEGKELQVPTFPALRDFARAAGVTGKLGEVNRVPSPHDFSAAFVVFVGVGSPKNTAETLQNFREAAGNVTRSVNSEELAFSFPTKNREEVLATVEGALLGAYRFGKYQSKPPKTLKTLCIPAHDALSDTERAQLQTTVKAVTRVRDLVNTSPSELYPESMAKAFQKASKNLPVSFEKWSYRDLKDQGFGGLVAVGKGSKRKPCLVKLTYAPEGAKAHVALVGKGITFDSGGYSLKPSTSMVTMKSDMTGAATMGAVCLAAAEMGLPVKVTAWLCLAENLVSGNASRVDDVITMKSGKTVEITNTDAEGRLVLADGLTMAVAQHPDLVIDMATLTGAQRIAFGTRMAGVMGCQKDRIRDASVAVGEPAWTAPLPEYLLEHLHSDVADIANSSSKREAGMLVAGIFLEQFVGDTPWAHIDIAGPGFNSGSAWGYTPKGGTGYGVRTLLRVIAEIGR